MPSVPAMPLCIPLRLQTLLIILRWSNFPFILSNLLLRAAAIYVTYYYLIKTPTYGFL